MCHVQKSRKRRSLITLYQWLSNFGSGCLFYLRLLKTPESFCLCGFYLSVCIISETKHLKQFMNSLKIYYILIYNIFYEKQFHFFKIKNIVRNDIVEHFCKSFNYLAYWKTTGFILLWYNILSRLWKTPLYIHD